MITTVVQLVRVDEYLVLPTNQIRKVWLYVPISNDDVDPVVVGQCNIACLDLVGIRLPANYYNYAGIYFY